MPQYRQIIRAKASPGQKRRRTTGGGFKEIQGPNTVKPILPDPHPAPGYPKGDPLEPPRMIRDERPPIEQRPLTSAAERLLADYLARVAFQIAITQGASVEWAGKECLGVKKTRAHAIANEMRDRPLEWFRRKALEGMQDESIGRGRETEKSPLADCFFSILSGGQQGIDYYKVSFGYSVIAYMDKVRGRFKGIEAECLDYLVHANLLWRK
jgi:hypothetical protein